MVYTKIMLYLLQDGCKQTNHEAQPFADPRPEKQATHPINQTGNTGAPMPTSTICPNCYQKALYTVFILPSTRYVHLKHGPTILQANGSSEEVVNGSAARWLGSCEGFPEGRRPHHGFLVPQPLSREGPSLESGLACCSTFCVS